ncbi:proline and serine-rich protein 3 isoform X2 [Carassius gibelio]|uniref:proline and serine-rich protein 3 isoform X2 n=1 Tax=Carassius gibelio TaxID=101364 RepID=UPI00227984AC|nr:proline and serine-rich protein 3 isoform X2 [Carassius gibelio]XP_052432343.1 proline and serine-rich protein 3 isoform X2 [Carassius gibelio]XP_052432344.1 proline and serine-rich protein 3 isoform X2 [Carassius gibelio]XP_052432345.1 proline and serine-rich protein 3 isoform X2 [Carassius gibelio]
MRSSAAVFTRQNPFPPDPPLSRSHYSPSRSRKIPKQQKRLVLSPVRFTEPPSPSDLPTQTSPLRTEDQVFHERSRSVRLCPPSTERQLSYSESWPSTDLSCSTDNINTSVCSEAQMQAMRNMVAPTIIEAKEPSVLAKYIERFRFGKPQSRDERRLQATDAEDDQPFWWMSTSPPSSSTPTHPSEKYIRAPLDLMKDVPASSQSSINKPLHDETTLSPVRHMLDLSMLTLSESSHCDQEEPELLQLQERASRLLQRSEHSLSSGSVPISSEGLGCSDFSSPISTDEPIRRPLVSTLIGSTNMIVEPSLCEGTSLPPPAVGSERSGVRREDDILFQWRLRRKMEQARQWSQEAPSHNSVLHIPPSVNKKAHCSTLNSTSHQRSNLSFTPVTLASLDPPVPQSALPISSPSISRLLPDEQPDPDIQPKPLPQQRLSSRKAVTKRLETPSAQPQHHKPIRTQASIPEPTADHRRSQTSSSQSPQTSDSTEEQWLDPHHKKDTTVREKTEHERHEKKIAPSSRKKKSERHGGERGSSAMRVRHARGHEGVSRKAEEPSGKSRWQEEGQSSARGGQSGNRAPPPSPIHNALGQVVSEVLFAGTDSSTQCKTPSSSDSPVYTPPPPPQSPAASCSGVQQPLEVIGQLMQDAEDSDGQEFEDDPLLQVLRQQRKWLKEQLWEVDEMLQQL